MLSKQEQADPLPAFVLLNIAWKHPFLNTGFGQTDRSTEYLREAYGNLACQRLFRTRHRF
jgi:hypothetical protein